MERTQLVASHSAIQTTSSPMVTDKTALRTQYRDIRRALSSEEREQQAQAVCEQLKQWRLFQLATRIAVYKAYGLEMDCDPIITAALEQGKAVYLPVIEGVSQQHVMRFHQYRVGDLLVKSRYQIEEPLPNTPTCEPADLELVFMPLLAFDTSGNRLGSGVGYYDKTFAGLPQAMNRKPLLVGVAYHQQQATSLPHDDWDVPLDVVITGNELLELNKSS